MSIKRTDDNQGQAHRSFELEGIEYAVVAGQIIYGVDNWAYGVYERTERPYSTYIFTFDSIAHGKEWEEELEKKIRQHRKLELIR